MAAYLVAGKETLLNILVEWAERNAEPEGCLPSAQEFPISGILCIGSDTKSQGVVRRRRCWRCSLFICLSLHRNEARLCLEIMPGWPRLRGICPYGTKAVAYPRRMVIVSSRTRWPFQAWAAMNLRSHLIRSEFKRSITRQRQKAIPRFGLLWAWRCEFVLAYLDHPHEAGRGIAVKCR